MGLDDEKGKSAVKRSEIDSAKGNGRTPDRSDSNSSNLLPGIVFLAGVLLVIGLIAAGVILIGGELLRQHDQQVADQYKQKYENATEQYNAAAEEMKTRLRGYAPGGMPATPTIIVKPDVPPNMLIVDKLDMTDSIVGQWQSRSATYGFHSTVSDNYNMTIYDDNTLIIHDRKNDTYIVGQWSRTPDTQFTEYTIVEPDRKDPVSVVGSFSQIQLLYRFPESTESSDFSYVNFVRTNYSGVFSRYI